MRTPMSYSQIVRGHVDSIARAINVANAQPNSQGVANANPILTWVRQAQRIPVRVHIGPIRARAFGQPAAQRPLTSEHPLEILGFDATLCP